MALQHMGKKVSESMTHKDENGSETNLHDHGEGNLHDNGEARVRVALGHTKGLPNYSSLRGDVSIELSCAVDDATETFNEATQWVNERLEELFATAESE